MDAIIDETDVEQLLAELAGQLADREAVLDWIEWRAERPRKPR